VKAITAAPPRPPAGPGTALVRRPPAVVATYTPPASSPAPPRRRRAPRVAVAAGAAATIGIAVYPDLRGLAQLVELGVTIALVALTLLFAAISIVTSPGARTGGHDD
jgi:hypothetical protein